MLSYSKEKRELDALRESIFIALKASPNGYTVDEMASRYDLPRSTIQPLFAELKRSGRLVEKGHRMKTNHSLSIVYHSA